VLPKVRSLFYINPLDANPHLNTDSYPEGPMLQRVKVVAVNVYNDINNNHTLAFAASLSYYFVLSLFPALIAMAAVLGFLPIPDLWGKTLDIFSRFVPPDSMGLVRRVLSDVITPNRGKILSVGLLGAVWAASSGFAAMIEALNVAYDVPETRPYWKTRLLAIALTFAIGSIMIVAAVVMILGPDFGKWVALHLHISWVFARLWPILRWVTTIAFVVAAIEGLYFWGPNVKQRFYSSLPGACIAVGGWIGLSYLLGIYFQKFANFNKTYGTLGAAIALMVWFYWTGFMILLGGEVNSELLQISGSGRLALKEPPPSSVTPKPATEADLAA
jgi:membrane protein